MAALDAGAPGFPHPSPPPLGEGVPASPAAVSAALATGATPPPSGGRLEGGNDAEAEEQTGEPHMLFGLGEYTLALPLAAVQAVERPGRFTAVPFAAPWLRGVTALRGAIISVVDLGEFAGLGHAGLTPSARLLVVQGGGLASALLVDRVRQITRLPEEPGPAPGQGPLSLWWRGAHTVDGEIVPIVDPERLMRSPEFLAIQASGVS